MSFIWNGVSSDTMKFNVTSRQVYNAPAYDLNAIEVPGRSGDLLNPQNRFKNKQVSYTGFLKATDFEGSTWREKLSTGLIQLKVWLCSDAGNYHELTDDYDPGFTRYGYISGETAISDIEDRPFGVTLTVTFNVKPYMYTAGEPMELPETKSASGDIITITDGAENTPLKSAVVNIEPVQDLHGYANPWPGGGGVNLLPPIASDQSVTQNNLTVTLKTDGTLTIVGKLDSGTTFFNAFTLSGTVDVDTSHYIYLFNNQNSSQMSISFRNSSSTSITSAVPSEADRKVAFTASGTVAILAVFVNSTAQLNMTMKPMIAKSNSVTAWQPYSNICPISGWTAVNGWHTGKNIISNSMAETGTAWNGGRNTARGRLVVQCKPSTKYTLSMNGTSSMSNIYRQDSAVVPASSPGGDITNRMPYTFTTGASSKYIIIAFSKTGITQGDVDALKLQLEEGSAATAYESTAVPINFSLGQTVYGGTLDVVNGKMTLTHAYESLNGTGWTWDSNNGLVWHVVTGGVITNGTTQHNKYIKACNMFIPTSWGRRTDDGDGTICMYYGQTRVAVKWSQITSASDAATLFNSTPLQVVYELATPQEYDVSPKIIKTLLGTNNIWADAGKMSIEYPIPTESPYPFESRPLYEITMAGTGTLIVNGKEWTITDYTGTLYCDTEAMEWYDASQLRNNIVSGDGWPVFDAGENSVSYTGDITKVMVTPRWRTL